ncbi:MAG: hypothetical protein AAGE52_20815 [Myxococcota bacterium]
MGETQALKLSTPPTALVPEAERLFEAARILVVGQDPTLTDGLVQELRALGCRVGIADASGRGLPRLDFLDPQVVLLEPGDDDLATLRNALSTHVRFRWAQIPDEFRWDTVWPPFAGAPNLVALGELVEPLTSLDRMVRAQAGKAHQFEVPLERIGPARVLRSLAGATNDVLRLTAEAGDVHCTVEICGDLIVGAITKVGGTDQHGVEALASFLRLERGRSHVERREHTGPMTIMASISIALDEAQNELLQPTLATTKEARVKELDDLIAASRPETAEEHTAPMTPPVATSEEVDDHPIFELGEDEVTAPGNPDVTSKQRPVQLLGDTDSTQKIIVGGSPAAPPKRPVPKPLPRASAIPPKKSGSALPRPPPRKSPSGAVPLAATPAAPPIPPAVATSPDETGPLPAIQDRPSLPPPPVVESLSSAASSVPSVPPGPSPSSPSAPPGPSSPPSAPPSSPPGPPSAPPRSSSASPSVPPMPSLEPVSESVPPPTPEAPASFPSAPPPASGHPAVEVERTSSSRGLWIGAGVIVLVAAALGGVLVWNAMPSDEGMVSEPLAPLPSHVGAAAEAPEEPSEAGSELAEAPSELAEAGEVAEAAAEAEAAPVAEAEAAPVAEAEAAPVEAPVAEVAAPVAEAEAPVEAAPVAEAEPAPAIAADAPFDVAALPRAPATFLPSDIGGSRDRATADRLLDEASGVRASERLRVLHAAALADDHNPHVAEALARHFLDRNELDAAEAWAREAVRLRRRRDRYRILLGDILVVRGDRAGARRAFDQAAELNPDGEGPARLSSL